MSKQNKYLLIDSELSNFNFIKNSLSYQILVESIYLLIGNKDLCFMPYIDGLYQELASKYNKTPKQVELSLSKLVERTLYNTDSKTIQSYFHIYQSDSVSLKAFISGITGNVRFKLKKSQNDKK